MNETLRTQIDEHCKMVSRGVKSLSILAHQEKYYDDVVNIIKEANLYYSSEIISDGWRVIYIYKNKTIRFLVPELPQSPTKPSEHALLGLLFGYDINSICDYILDKCELDEPNLI